MYPMKILLPDCLSMHEVARLVFHSTSTHLEVTMTHEWSIYSTVCIKVLNGESFQFVYCTQSAKGINWP